MTCFGDDTRACQMVSLGKFTDRSGKVGHVEVMRCKQCGHGVSKPPLPDVTFLYENRASQDYQPDSRGFSHLIKNLAFRKQAKRLLKEIGGSKGRILDFGCGSGQFTRVLGDVAGAANVTGADMHEDRPRELIGRGYLGPSELGAQRGSFDVVLAMHVLEHDDDAHGLLATIAGYARKGGKVVIEVPNIDCVWSVLFGKHWDAWYLPYHRQHFTRASLIKSLERGGLEVESIHDVTVPTMGRSIANLFGQTNNLLWLLLGIAVYPVQVLGEAVTGRRTAIRAVAVRAT